VTPLCFIDTETDSLAPWRRPWDIAVIRRESDGTERTLQLYVEIPLSETPDLFGLKVGRFWDRHPVGQWLAAQPGPNAMRDVSDYPVADMHTLRAFDDEPTSEGLYVTREQAARLVARWTNGCHVVGAVPNFDAEVFTGLLREQHLIPAHHYHLIDVETLAVGYLYGSRAGLAFEPDSVLDLPWDSDKLSESLAVEPPADDERHTALGDARWAMRLYDAIIGAMP
jgi:hypothetical protein